MTKVFTSFMMSAALTLWLLPLSGNTISTEQTEWNKATDLKKYQSILEKAQAADKMLFVVLSDDRNANWQKMQEEKILDNDIVNTALQDFIAIEIPVRSEMGSRWVQLFPAEDIPAFYFLGNDEFLFLTETGYQNSINISALLKKAADVKDNYGKLIAKYSEGNLNNTSEWKTLLEIHSLNFPFEQTKTVALEFLNRFKSNDQLLQNDVLPVLITYGIDLQTSYPKKVIDNRERIFSTMSDFSFEDYFANVYSYNFDLAVNSEDSIFIEKLVSDIISYNPDSLSTSRELALETRRLYAEQTGHLNIWGKGILEYAEGIDDPKEKAEAIFDVAYTIADEYNSRMALLTALKLARQAGNIHSDFRYTMLESYMNYLLKNYQEAEQLVRKASTQTENPNNLRKADGLLKMILQEKPQEEYNEETGEE